ncbi:MAG TPA: alpha/beta fold hydrolase [Longimicrobiales bacterium]|nr:alpha/beta fold hydrolase [Longimicrobiales bacterium]
MTLKRSNILALCVMAVLTAILLGPRARVDGRVAPVDVPTNVDSFVLATEAVVQGIREGDRKRIVWAAPESRTRTPIAVVYLHGFSADPHELDPVPHRLADSLGANLFVTRLAGHGLEGGDGLAAATAADWLRDTEEAVAIGARLGERVVLMGTSTGGTLAVWAAAHSRRRDTLAALVLVSPNFGPRDAGAELLLWPWGGLLARGVVGRERCWTPANDEQSRHWTTCYPTKALLPMMALVDLVGRMDLSRVSAPALVLLSSRDQVVDPDQTRRRVPLFGSPIKEFVEIAGDGDPSHHVLAGDILSPGTTDTVVAEVLSFVRRLMPSTDPLP